MAPFILLFIIGIVTSSDISLQSQSIHVEIKDRYTFITYSFEFKNTNELNASELYYSISLQPNSFISYFIAELNGQTFRGETKEKEEAQEEYDNAVDSGLSAVLISQAIYHIFHQILKYQYLCMTGSRCKCSGYQYKY